MYVEYLNNLENLKNECTKGSPGRCQDSGRSQKRGGSVSVSGEEAFVLRSGSLQDRDLTPLPKSSGKTMCVQRASETELILLLS